MSLNKGSGFVLGLDKALMKKVSDRIEEDTLKFISDNHIQVLLIVTLMPS